MVIGHDTVVLRTLEFAPPWIVREAYEAEQKTETAYTKLLAGEKFRKAQTLSVATSRNKLKVNEDGSLKLKARICPHGSRDSEMEDLR